MACENLRHERFIHVDYVGGGGFRFGMERE